jgi:hypothetical protein
MLLSLGEDDVPVDALTALEDMMIKVGRVEYMAALLRAHPDTVYRAMYDTVKERDEAKKNLQNESQNWHVS